MNDDNDIPSIFNNNRTATGNPPLFTCSIKLDKQDYEKKVELTKTISYRNREKT